MPPTATPTPVAERTRRDLVDAAIRCWAVDSSASLGVVAQEARTGRTTLHRYFATRVELVAAVDLECRRRFDEALQLARPDEGSGLDALRRACAELVGLGPVLGLIFADNALVDPDQWHRDGTRDSSADGGPDTGADGGPDEDDPLVRVITRAYADGSADVSLPPEWVATIVWTTLFAAWLCIRSGSTTAHEAALLCGSTVTRSVGARSSPGTAG